MFGVAAGVPTPAAGSQLGLATTTTVGEAANQTTVHLKLGDRLVVTLHSTYWEVTTPPRRLLEHRSGPTVTRGTGCAAIPGTGCGTVTVSYAAKSVGSVEVAAHRAACGEALRCTGGNGVWWVRVDISSH
jgi:hypothetical protein